MHRISARDLDGSPNLVRVQGWYLRPMIDSRMLDDLRSRIEGALRDSPAQDIERNLRTLLASWFDRLDLVLREDFEVQKKLLERAQAKLAELEARVAELEASRPPR
jgi:BMFP domain-containing protein YqiC